MRLFSVLPIKFYCVERQKILLFFISTVHDFELLAQFVAAQCRCIAGWWLHCCVAGAAVPTQYRSRWHCRQKGRGVCQSEREHRHHHPTRPLHADRFGALAELERENILERQREGIEIAKSEGKYKGRKPIDYNEAQMKALCKKWRAGEITATAAMKELGLKPNTFYRRVKEMGL